MLFGTQGNAIENVVEFESFNSFISNEVDNKPHNLLINGKGRYYNRIWAEAKQTHRRAEERTTQPVEPLPKSQVDFVQTLPRQAKC